MRAVAPARQGMTVLYVRISKDDDETELGVKRQEKLGRRLAASLGIEIDLVLSDNNLSAFNKKTRRPDFERLMTLMESDEVASLIVYASDRLIRRTADLERIIDAIEGHGVMIHAVNAGEIDLSTVEGRLMARVLASMAMAESEKTSKRIKDKNDELAEAGAPRSGGVAPYGYRKVGGWIEIDPETSSYVRQIADGLFEGKTLYRISNDLNEAGAPRRARKNASRFGWTPEGVRQTILNPQLAGLRVHRKEIVGPAEWPGILTRSEHEQVVAILNDPRRRRASKAARPYLLTGLVYTTEGDKMTGRAVDDKKGERQYQYATRYPCALSTTIDAPTLEDLVVKALLRQLARAPKKGATGGKGDGAAQQVVDLEAEIAELAAMLGTGDLTRAEWAAMRRPLMDRLATARKSTASVRPGRAIAVLFSTPEKIADAWEALDADAKRAILREAIERIVVGRGRIGGGQGNRPVPPIDRLDPDAGLGGSIVWRI